jgi:hypothetical protein
VINTTADDCPVSPISACYRNETRGTQHLKVRRPTNLQANEVWQRTTRQFQGLGGQLKNFA